MSQLKSESKEIDGNSYEVYMLPPMLSQDLLMDVAKMVGPALGPVLDKFFNGGNPDVLSQELGADFFSRATSTFFIGLDKKVMRDVIGAMANVSNVDGRPLKVIFDIHFLGRLEIMYQWLMFAMRVQWGNSLSALVKVAPQGAQKMMGRV